MKAMILAAGRGQRLRPLTDKIPKPLIKVGSHSLIEHHIKHIAAANFESIVINIAHLGELIREKVGDGSRFGIPIHYSDEGEHALETGGGIAKALPLLGDDPFLAVSSDIYCDIEFDANYKLAEKLAHLIMVNNPAHHIEGDFDAHAINLPQQQHRFTYSGVGYFDPSLFKNKPKVFPLVESIKAAIASRKVDAALHTGSWHDVGTAARLHAAHKEATASEAS